MAERCARRAIVLVCALALTAGTATAAPGQAQARGYDAGPMQLARNDDKGQVRERGGGKAGAQQRTHDAPRDRDSRNGQDSRERSQRRAADDAQAQRAERSRSGQPAQSPRREEPSPEQRRRLEQRQQSFRALPGEQQQRLRQAEESYRSMSPERREELRRRWEGMSESDRARYRRRVEKRDD